MKGNNLEGTIILFNTTSNLHNKLLQFIEKKESENHLTFVPFDSKIGKVLIQKLNLTKTELSFIILLENGQYYTQSTAILKLTKYLEGRWSSARFFLILPKTIRDNLLKLMLYYMT